MIDLGWSIRLICLPLLRCLPCNIAMVGNYNGCMTLLINTHTGNQSHVILTLDVCHFNFGDETIDQTTMFEWQKYSQGSKEMPDFIELLEFLDLRAWATENTREESEQKHSCKPSSKKTASRPSYAVNAGETCMVSRMTNIHRTLVKSLNPSASANDSHCKGI